MTPEQRLDRLERIAKLFDAAGIRARRNMRELDEKIGILVNLHIQNEERFKDQDDKINVLIDLQQSNEARFRGHDDKINALADLQQSNEERFAKLVESQSNTDLKLQKLMEVIAKGRNGKS